MDWMFRAYENMPSFLHSTDVASALPNRVFIRALGRRGGSAGARAGNSG